MTVRLARVGDPRIPDEGLRLGVVRRPPRGVRKADYAVHNYFDVWFPDLAPSNELVAWYHAEPMTHRRWRIYTHRYLREMRDPSRERLLTLLAHLSHQANFSIGCYCEDENFCHRSILRELLAERGADVA